MPASSHALEGCFLISSTAAGAMPNTGLARMSAPEFSSNQLRGNAAIPGLRSAGVPVASQKRAMREHAANAEIEASSGAGSVRGVSPDRFDFEDQVEDLSGLEMD